MSEVPELREIIKDGEIQTIRKKRYIPVLISNEALSQINKIVLGDKVDVDDTKQTALRNQIHEDCLRLFKEFN
jgi:hypothetical protein